MKIIVLLATLSLSLAAPGLEKVDPEHPFPFHPTVGGRIVGGETTTIDRVPYTVGLLRNGALICGGVLIGPRTVLTAAHCVAPSVISNVALLNIRSGSSTHNNGGLRIAVTRMISHPLYRDCWWCEPDYDIAVLELASNAIATGLPASVISMYEQNADFNAGTYATVAGWGATTEGGAGSTQLRKVNVPVVGNAECARVYGSIISSRTICAGYPAGGRDACQGDSGGPFVINNRLAGVVSFGAGCARPGFPGVYASVPGYRQWIRENSGI
ncbi:trypsin 3A1-like [Anthonomus grandis grandis]|uniref:trypsin 3A1-like n=1 Tax=Anthonomus grandis grandis TaxID=2921223 RepID=UPI00216559B5|nr:trypsin 3A1-like [Anthonomus grandis grandis]